MDQQDSNYLSKGNGLPPLIPSPDVIKIGSRRLYWLDFPHIKGGRIAFVCPISWSPVKAAAYFRAKMR